MASKNRTAWFVVPCTVAAVVFLAWYARREPVAGRPLAADRPRLAVLVVFDQMRGDYLSKWQPLFGPGGFRRIFTEGAWFTDCHYPYAETVTAAGHASLVTGCSPRSHGIFANDWYDRKLDKKVASITPDPSRRLPGVEEARMKGPGPYRRRQPSVGDALLDRHKGKSKVASLSIKDRSAILMAALWAQVCYWFNTLTGNFETSPFYRPRNHDWVEAFNKSRYADRWFDKEWKHLLPNLDYERYSGPDNVAAEGTGYGQGRAFPHGLKGYADEVGPGYFNAMNNSPFGNDMLLELAKRTIVEEKLGHGEGPDLLCLSFTSNDLVGHCWGPDSQEVLDITLRSDVIIKELLEFLDQKVGRGQYVLVVSADHGVCPLPELVKAQGKDAGRVPMDVLGREAAKALQAAFAPDEPKTLPWFESFLVHGFYLNDELIKSLKLDQARVEKTLADWCARQPGILAAFSRGEMLGAQPLDDPIAESMRLSFHPENSGDVMFVMKPYYLLWYTLPLKGGPYMTSHGSPHPYDTHVPLLVYGWGVRPGTHNERVTPQAAAAILAHALGVAPPAGAEYPVPPGLFSK